MAEKSISAGIEGLAASISDITWQLTFRFSSTSRGSMAVYHNLLLQKASLSILSLCHWLNLAISGKLHLAAPPLHSARKGKINSEFKHYQFLKAHCYGCTNRSCFSSRRSAKSLDVCSTMMSPHGESLSYHVFFICSSFWDLCSRWTQPFDPNDRCFEHVFRVCL
jgi:ribosomal protein S27E